MKNLVIILLAISVGITTCRSGNSGADGLFEKDNLVAWCIVPFDAMDRTPGERAEMLSELGFTHFAYDYRARHVPSFREEINVLKDHHITLSAVWLWADPYADEIPDSSGRQVFPDEESLARTTAVVSDILRESEEIGCTLALYNHGGWFGEPENMIRIIESVGTDRLRIVYNFHHGQHQVEHFKNNLEMMLPYLSTININGMRVEGPKIITLGQGDRELEMLRIIKASGYTGPIGILGHTEGEDIREVLQRNLEDLEKLKKSL